MERFINERFFGRSAEKVARDLIGKTLIRKYKNKIFKGLIIETEAYFDEEDPGSWARFGKRKDNLHMWGPPGTVLVKNVHKYMMLNFVTGKEGEAGAVLLRALEPINFEGRASGPGLLTKALFIDRALNGKNVLKSKELFIKNSNKKFEIERSFRIGLKKDLKIPFRFYMKGSQVSRKK